MGLSSPNATGTILDLVDISDVSSFNKRKFMESVNRNNPLLLVNSVSYGQYARAKLNASKKTMGAGGKLDVSSKTVDVTASLDMYNVSSNVSGEFECSGFPDPRICTGSSMKISDLQTKVPKAAAECSTAGTDRCSPQPVSYIVSGVSGLNLYGQNIKASFPYDYQTKTCTDQKGTSLIVEAKSMWYGVLCKAGYNDSVMTVDNYLNTLGMGGSLLRQNFNLHQLIKE